MKIIIFILRALYVPCGIYIVTLFCRKSYLKCLLWLQPFRPDMECGFPEHVRCYDKNLASGLGFSAGPASV